MTEHQHLSAADIAGRLNLTKQLRGWRGECPSCAYAGTFSLKAGREGRALFYCASCHDVQAIQSAVATRLGMPQTAPQAIPRLDDAAARERRQAGASACWTGAGPLLGTPAAANLTMRGLACLIHNRALRFRLDVSHPEGRGLRMAMVALVTGPAGQFAAVHRTYLTREGGKADVVPNRATLGVYWGGAVRLHDPLPDTGTPQLVVGEGIESSASAGVLLRDLPVWAALSAGNLASGLILPADVRSLVVAADHDAPGREAALAAAARWRAEGRTVKIATPDKPGEDFNDVLMSRANG